MKAGGGHFEHTLKCTTCDILVFVITDNENYKFLLIIPCTIENMAQKIYTAITLEKTKIFF